MIILLQVSKFGGGMGLYFGKVRASGQQLSAALRGLLAALSAGSSLLNDTAVAVDQLGMRQGAVAVYLDAVAQRPAGIFEPEDQ